MIDINENNKDKINEMNKQAKKDVNSDNSDIYNNILENQIQKRAFLTNMPSNNNYIENKQKLNELKHLKEKKRTLIKKINILKNKRDELNEISFNNINKAKIDNNMLHNNKKNINSLEKNLIDKLNEVKQQIKILDKNEENIKEENKTNIKLKLKKENKEFDEDNIKEQLLNHNKIRLKEIENKYKKMKKELINEEDDLDIKREDNLKIKKEEENELIKKRQFENDYIMEKLNKDIKLPPKLDDCLYQRMEKEFEEKEKKLIHDVSTERKFKNIYYKQESGKINIKKHKNDLEKRAKEQTDNMKKLWHSRSMMLKQCQNSKNNKENKNEEETKKEEKKNEKKDREEYGKEKVKLPPINEKLKEESKWRQIDIKNLKGKERINYINKKYMKKGLKILNVFKNLDYGKKYVLRKERKINNLYINRFGNNSMNNIKSIKYRNILFQNNKTDDYHKIKKRLDNISPKEINYLNELKDKKKREFHKWNGYIINRGDNELDTDGIRIINKKVEKLDEKVKMVKELMNANGGFEYNTELGYKVNNLLIDSIKGKLAILDEIYIDNNDK